MASSIWSVQLLSKLVCMMNGKETPQVYFCKVRVCNPLAQNVKFPLPPRQVLLFVPRDLGRDAIRELPGNANDFGNFSPVSSAITLVLKTQVYSNAVIYLSIRQILNSMLVYIQLLLEDSLGKCR